MDTPAQYRQGDLLFVEIASRPPKSQKVPHTVVEEGEQTGHLHEAVGDIVMYEDGNVKFLEVLGPASVIHPEHGPITLPKGVYQVIRQREYTEKAPVNVRD